MTRRELLSIAKPIPMKSWEVQAILKDQKSSIRLVMKPQPIYLNGFWWHGAARWSEEIKTIHPIYGHRLYNRIPYKPGDYLYVRETWRPLCAWRGSYSGCEVEYKAGGKQRFNEVLFVPKQNEPEPWHPSIHMPKEAARIFLRVTDVRVERLHQILNDPPGPQNQTVREGFRYDCDFVAVWDRTVKPKDRDKYGWDANPWVWATEFEQVEVE